MGSREDELKARIERKFGSIPKFCEESGLATSTVYNIFDRGVENTRTRTMDIVYSYIDTDGDVLDDEEVELLETFRKMSDKHRAAILDIARAMVE